MTFPMNMVVILVVQLLSTTSAYTLEGQLIALHIHVEMVKFTHPIVTKVLRVKKQ